MSHDRPNSRPSLLGALLLIGLGVLLLLPHRPDFWHILARFWPLLLIAWGAIRLIEFFLPQGTRRGGLSAGEVVLIFFLVVFGGLFSMAYHYRHSPFGRWIGLRRAWYWENHYPYRAQAQAALARGMRVRVRGGRTSVTLLAGNGPRLLVENSETVYARTPARAQARFASYPLKIERRGGELVVWATGQQSGSQIESQLRLTLPPATPVSIRVRHGGLKVTGWRSRLSIKTGDGSVEGRDLRAAIRIVHTDGDIGLSRVSGGVSIEGNGGDARLQAIAGPVRISGDYTGFVELRQIGSGVQFDSGRAHIRLASLAGKLTWSIGRLTITRGTAIDLTTRDQDVNLSGFQGGLRISDQDGSLHLATGRLDGAIHAATREGDITLALPAGAAFQLYAGARNGDLHSDFPLSRTGSGSPAMLQGQVGNGGPAVSLTTTDGAIRILKNAGLKNTGAGQGKQTAPKFKLKQTIS